MDDKKGETCSGLGVCGGAAGGGSEGSCCICDQEDGCACKNGPNNFKCLDGHWKIEAKEGSDYNSGGSSGGGCDVSRGCGCGLYSICGCYCGGGGGGWGG